MTGPAGPPVAPFLCSYCGPTRRPSPGAQPVHAESCPWGNVYEETVWSLGRRDGLCGLSPRAGWGHSYALGYQMGAAQMAEATRARLPLAGVR